MVEFSGEMNDRLCGSFCLPLVVETGIYARFDCPVEVWLDFKELLPAVVGNDCSFLVVEVDGDRWKKTAVFFQYDPHQSSPNSGTLTFILSGKTAAHATRTYHLYLFPNNEAAPQTLPPPQISYSDDIPYQGQESIKITTPTATYIYHKQGAGFASLQDIHGKDWISFRPGGGSDGRFRGIPNLIYPEGAFHPGDTSSTTRILSSGPLKLTLHSETNDQKWACTWEIFPTFARLTVLKAAHSYWFLYEGTPGGQLDLTQDYIVRHTANGIQKTGAATSWDDVLPEPAWVYFGSGNSDQALFLLQHEATPHQDSYWQMEENMTVFGYGRLGIKTFLNQTPAHFTIGLAPATDTPAILNKHTQKPTTTVGHIQTTPDTTKQQIFTFLSGI